MTSQTPRIDLPDAPILMAGAREAIWLTTDGEILRESLTDARARVRGQEPPILVHAPATTRRIGGRPFPCFDLLELFAFAKPAQFCTPTPAGLAEALGLPLPRNQEDAVGTIRRCAIALLQDVGLQAGDPDARRIAWAMARGGWPWGPFVLAALGQDPDDMSARAPTAGLDVWRRLPEWEEEAPPPPPGDRPIAAQEARARLDQLLGRGAEPRPSQADYAAAAAKAFAPRDHEGAPHMVLAEAGTGVGKTMGYIAPASLWAERNEAPVWISTYTRNLQHQIDRELDRLVPDPEEKRERVVIRKGRENYLCLLNMEEAVRGVPVRAADAVPLGLIARWGGATRDGDLMGGDFPSWLIDLLGPGRTLGLADRRGECIYSACPHYSRCYIEHGVRRAKKAELVIANHALVMINAARGTLDIGGRATRFVFDEGHHVFDAADSAFSAHLSGREMSDLRRWVRGFEGQGRSRARGLKDRASDLVGGDEDAQGALDDLIRAAGALPSEGWPTRIGEDQPAGPAEALLARIRQQVYARAEGARGPFDLEVETNDPVEGLLDAAAGLDGAFARMEGPAKLLVDRLRARLDEEADELDSSTRIRIDAVARSIEQRLRQTIGAWRSMLASLAEGVPAPFVDWFAVERSEGRDLDIGLHRHWIDPTIPFAQAVAGPAHGLLVTSATLTSGQDGEGQVDWAQAEARAGAVHLPKPADRVRVPSPFRYAEQTRVLVVNDVRKDDLKQVAAAYRELFLASGGGALGLFTAIGRLRAVHDQIAPALDGWGLPLYAQHVDALNLPSLIEIFRAEEDACLLGTDAVRDGVDVPGRALRLIVFDRVPWPRPTILHRARREAFGKKNYDDALTRLKLKQAFGRLVRRADDKGVFVLLDPMMPTRLTTAFPEGVAVERIGLAEATRIVRDWLNPNGLSRDVDEAGAI